MLLTWCMDLYLPQTNMARLFNSHTLMVIGIGKVFYNKIDNNHKKMGTSYLQLKDRHQINILCNLSTRNVTSHPNSKIINLHKALFNQASGVTTTI